jgi:hypothetical protein
MVCPNGVQILSFDLLKNLRRASVLVFTSRRPLKTLNFSWLAPIVRQHRMFLVGTVAQARLHSHSQAKKGTQ